ncbi:MAG: hypothetical protein WAO57_10145 [Syntrophomonadaceae bacterium]|jgi:Na+-transporting methylmalonyl-CoA/oxaloacetate decarboxylase gamma subunit
MTKMDHNIIKILKNPWSITVLGGVVVFLLTSILNSLIQNVNFIESAKNIIIFIFEILKSIFIFKVPIWLVILFLCGLIFMLYIVSEWKNTAPQWMNYKSDYFFEWLFAWEYSNYLGTMKITGLRPICSKCKCELSLGSIHYQEILYCPDCGSKYKLLTENTIDDVEKIIINRIKHNNFKIDVH